MEFTGEVTYADGSAVSWTQPSGVQVPGFARATQAAPAVTVSAESAAPRPVVPAPVPQPAAQANTLGGWMNTVVKFVMSI